MQKQITIKYQNGEEESFIAYPPDFVRWEKASGKPISQFSSMWDILFLAHSAMKRELKSTEPLEIWMEKVAEVSSGDQDPKVTSAEV